MKKKNFLHALVHSLTPGERQFFLEYSNRRGGRKNYLQLFHAIAQQPTYDEADIRRQFASARFTRNLSVAKDYLYNAILNALHVTYQDEASTLLTIQHKINILKAKSLYAQALRHFPKAYALAERQENFRVHSELLKTELSIYRMSDNDAAFSERYEPIEQKELALEAKQANINAFQRLVNRSIAFEGKGIRTATEAQVRDLLNHPLVRDTGGVQSQRALIYHHMIRVNAYHLLRDYPRCIASGIAIVNTYAAHPDFLSEPEHLQNYIRFVYRVSQLHRLNDDFIAGLQWAERLLQIKSRNRKVQADVRARYYILRLTTAILQPDRAMGLEAAFRIDKELDRIGDELEQGVRARILLLLTVLHAREGNVVEARNWGELLAATVRNYSTHDDIRMGQLVLLVVYYEAAEDDLLERTLVNFRQQLKRDGGLMEDEKHVFKCLRRLLTAANPTARRKTLREFIASAPVTVADARGIRRLFPFVDWARSRISGASISEFQA